MSEVDLQQQVVDLQARLVFQEDLLQSLDKVVAQQDKTIAALSEAIGRWESRLDEVAYSVESGGTTTVETPPHY